MKETEFIDQNKDKWAKFEKDLNSSSANPEEIRDSYTELNNDLSYAQTFYEKRMVRSYLNNLAQSIHRKLYKQKKEPFSAVVKTWTVDLPLEIYRARKNLLLAFVLFLIYGAIGAFSTHQDIGFADKILGSSYIQMTEENILLGNPMGVYGTSSQGTMFFQITLNNIYVALLCFVGGAFFSMVTHVLLFQNAVMVGVFQYFFKMKGLLLTSFLGIWIHGAFEISAIVIASGAGFTLGHGILFPGSYTRMQSLQMSGMRGVRIMLSLIPIFIMAGFLESYVTRHYQFLPDWSKWMIILFSFTFMIFYYVIYPAIVARKYPEKVFEKSQINILDKIDFKPFKIRKNIEVFSESFQLFLGNLTYLWKTIFTYTLFIVVPLIAYQVYRHYDGMNTFYGVDWQEQLSILFGSPNGQNYNGVSDTIVSLIWVVPITIAALATFYVMKTLEKDFNQSFTKYVRERFVKMAISMALIYGFLLHFPMYIVIPAVFVFPYLILMPASVGLDSNPSMKSGFKLSAQKWTSSLVVLVLLSVMVFFLAQPIAFVLSYNDYKNEPYIGDFLDMLSDFLLPIFAEVTDNPTTWVNVVRQVFYITFIFTVLPVFLFAFGLIYYSGKEERDLVSINDDFKNFGKRSRTRETNIDFE